MGAALGVVGIVCKRGDARGNVIHVLKRDFNRDTLRFLFYIENRVMHWFLGTVIERN